MTPELELLFHERVNIAEGEYCYRAYLWTKALLGSHDGLYLILCAGVDDSRDDSRDFMDNWIPDRCTLVRPSSRHAAVRLAVEDANTWRSYVASKLSTFPRTDIKNLRLTLRGTQ